jgi:deoxycytidine triphosphate deaminase
MKINPKTILDNKILVAVPGFSPIDEKQQLQQNGIDVRLAKAEKVVGVHEMYLDKNKDKRPDLIEMQVVDGCYHFEPGYQYALTFMEDVKVPSGMCATVVHRSTVNRFSGTLLSALFDGGFESKGGCGAMFRPNVKTKIEVGCRVAQIVFDSAEEASLYNGQYQRT